MADDPEQIFADGSDTQRECVKTIWPELYSALARPVGDRSPIGCVIGECTNLPTDTRPRAAGRLSLNGAPACDEHLRRAGRRYPLDLTDPRVSRN